jgi:hypothetical protein
MNSRTKQRDSIDNELLKTYFGPGNKTKDHLGVKNKPENKDVLSKRYFKWLLALILGAFAVFVFFRFFPLIGNRVSSLPDGPIYTAQVSSPSLEIMNEKVLYDFEHDDEGWNIPAWALDKTDHVAENILITRDIASRGDKSLKVVSAFPGDNWTASLVEILHFLDLAKYDVISSDFYLPPEAPKGLRAKIILTVGDDWKFVEMSRAVKLEPGKWTNVSASLKDNSTDWKRTKVDRAFRSDVRKVALRVESDRKPAYSGPVYIDNIRVGTVASRN